MHIIQEEIVVSTDSREGLYDITQRVEHVVTKSGLQTGQVTVYVQGATAAVMIQENWDNSVQEDVISLLRKLAPRGVWQHDLQDGNGDAHLKAGLVGPSETIPIIQGNLGLSQWQNIFCCEFDGPRSSRTVIVTAIGE
ncbi:MAG: secondary thiamine-phosphate synthase enzyme YjbQ [Nanoarchaeota archaeon]